MNLQLCCCYSPRLPIALFPCTHFCWLHSSIGAAPLHFRTSFCSKNIVAVSNNSVSSSSGFLDDKQLMGRVTAAKDASEVLLLFAEGQQRSWGTVDAADCRFIISAAIENGNIELALSVFSAMRSSVDSGWMDNEASLRWKWSRPDVETYTLLVIALASSLRVADALRLIECVCRVGVHPGEEVSFGKVVRCPTCVIAVAVAQPQHGFQLVSCSKCRYQYELVSGKITTIESEEIRISSCRTQHGCSSMEAGFAIPASNEAKVSISRSFHRGGNTIGNGKNPQVCN